MGMNRTLHIRWLSHHQQFITLTRCSSRFSQESLPRGMHMIDSPQYCQPNVKIKRLSIPILIFLQKDNRYVLWNQANTFSWVRAFMFILPSVLLNNLTIFSFIAGFKPMTLNIPSKKLSLVNDENVTNNDVDDSKVVL